MDCNLTFICGTTAKRSYTMNYIGNKTASWSCGDNVKNLTVKEATFSVVDHAKAAAKLLISSNLCDWIRLGGGKLEWKCSSAVKARYTFRLVRNCRYFKFVEAVNKALKYEEKVNPIVSVAYFFSKLEHIVSYGGIIFSSSMDMISTTPKYGFMRKADYEALLNSTCTRSHQSLYINGNTQTFDQLVEAWNAT